MCDKMFNSGDQDLEPIKLIAGSCQCLGLRMHCQWPHSNALLYHLSHIPQTTDIVRKAVTVQTELLSLA